MKRIVIVDLAGGIGNQIFLFQAARSIAAINNRVIRVNTTNIDSNHSNGKSTIEDFIFPDNVQFFKFNRLANKIYFRLQKWLLIFNNYPQSLTLMLNEDFSENHIDEIHRIILKRNPRFIIISGFWQNFVFWDDSFKFKLKLESVKYRELDNNLATQNPIVFHYRLGRINNRWEHGWGALSPDFLSNALATLNQNNLSSKIIWIFSNDITEARRLTESINYAPFKLVYIDDSKIMPSETMVLLSKAKILICSNSTFSILCGKIGSIENVIAPLELSKNGHKNFELPSNWKRVKSVWLD
jgi:hypothetical protein